MQSPIPIRDRSSSHPFDSPTLDRQVQPGYSNPVKQKESPAVRVKVVTLVPMTEAEYEAFLEWAIPDYAQDNVRSGTWPEAEALQRSEEQYRELLPQGLHTPGQYLFTVRDPKLDSSVGLLWFSLELARPGKPAFLYQFKIEEAFRRQGYGLAALRALEEKVRALGAGAILLHVFGHNAPARTLYEKAGYATIDLVMAKGLAPAEDA